MWLCLLEGNEVIDSVKVTPYKEYQPTRLHARLLRDALNQLDHHIVGYIIYPEWNANRHSKNIVDLEV